MKNLSLPRITKPKKCYNDLAKATLVSSEQKVLQARSAKVQATAQLLSAQRKVAQAQALVARSNDVLAEYDATAPLDGVVTNLPVRVGETVVPGCSELGCIHHHDHCGHVHHHRRSTRG